MLTWTGLCSVVCVLLWQISSCLRYPLLPPTGEEEEEEDEEEEEEEDGDWEEAEVSVHDQQLPMKVLPLYSLLSSERQSEVGQPISPSLSLLAMVAAGVATSE